MSSAPLRSPALRPHRMKKDESFLGKLGGTLARKKKAKEAVPLGLRDLSSPTRDRTVPPALEAQPLDNQGSPLFSLFCCLSQPGKSARLVPELEIFKVRGDCSIERGVSDLQEEGKNAINLPMSPASVEIHPEDTLLEENQERMVIDPTSRDDPRFRELVKVLIDWVNDVLVGERIIVKQLEEDLYDGQVLQKLLEKLAGCKLNVAEVTQSEIAQKQKLQTALQAVQELLRPHGRALQWTVDTIHGKNLVAILHLLVALAMHFRAPIRLPEHVSVQVVVIRKREGLLHSSHITEELTTTTEMMMGRFERDAFDTLFDHAPDKLSVVKKFADGVYLVLLMGLLEDYFVPLHNFYLTPDSFDQKVHNVSFAFELMLDGGLKKPKARPEDVVNLDLKSTLRVLYNLFTKYKHLE
ncbi:beta-parvin isoform X3 [Phocoena sinus]|uniref:beta-parvin isoform X3 n=2 Tax=Phocoena TaxID=9741 RepID=UPI0013C4B13D|nr:beta-parvin isoform X3 [Phocoena sinus]